MTRYLLDTNIISNIVKRLVGWHSHPVSFDAPHAIDLTFAALQHKHGATVGRDCGIETKVSVERTLSV